MYSLCVCVCIYIYIYICVCVCINIHINFISIYNVYTYVSKICSCICKNSSGLRGCASRGWRSTRLGTDEPLFTLFDAKQLLIC